MSAKVQTPMQNEYPVEVDQPVKADVAAPAADEAAVAAPAAAEAVEAAPAAPEEAPEYPVEPKAESPVDTRTKSQTSVEGRNKSASGSLRERDPVDGANDAEERLALARAKAAAAKSAVADRRASNRSVDADSIRSEGGASGAHGRARRSSSGARRGSIRSVFDSVDEAEEALRAMDEREREMDERLQVYSEVVGLRKELRVVRDDANRTRAQLQLLSHASNQDVPSAADLAAAEEAAGRSSVQHQWTAACRRFPCAPDDVTSWAKVRVDDLVQRLAAAEAKFYKGEDAAVKLLSTQEATINANTDARDRAKAELNASVEEEMMKLAETRDRLRQVEREQWFHIKRGTHVKQRQTPARARKEATQHRAYQSETKEVGDVVQLVNERTELTEQVRQFRRALEDNKHSYMEEQKQLEQQLEAAEENGKDARELRERFEKENEDLRNIKQDLQRVLQYVRVRNREGME
ncbi:uncharacterized protein TM35_000191710 [Trypanosoma theileri]|uniref:Uncharacterized protein n=1 Tax=Trypanosoma theileri TaxID=67003 RepID=A0A1X0NT91_9TRYP|nr:uncharacterized protein TM35_000191710 [Trypanosoma theileri]ORC87927.1 hypothetical protein TM35_000191710 [Trypanosoma theileri]